MVEIVNNPTFKPPDFDASSKKPGVSAIMRLRNEAEFLDLALESIFELFDELIIVYNQCTDRTPEIVAKYGRRDPQRVRAFHYLPEVCPPRTEMHGTLPAGHVSSFVHYSNFALSKASFQITTLWDGDMIAEPDALGRVLDRLRSIRPWGRSWWLSPWLLGYWWFKGVNLWDQDGKVFVVRLWPASGSKFDHGFWPVRRWHIFRHYSRGEYLRTWWLKRSFVGFVFFHVKWMKSDRGTSIRQMGAKRFERTWINPELITFEDYCQIEPEASSLPAPEAMGIQPVRG